MTGHDRISSIVLIIIGMIYCFASVRIDLGTFRSPGPGLVPFLAGVFLVLSLLPTLISSIFEKKLKVLSPVEPVSLRKGIKAIIGFSVYTFFLPILGYIIGTFLLMLFFFKGVETLKWKWAVIAAILTTLASYMIFDIWLQSMLPVGFIDIRGLMRWIF